MTSAPRVKTRQEKLQLLNTFELSPNASRNILISTVKDLRSRGVIRTCKEAETLIGYAQNTMTLPLDFDILAPSLSTM